MDLTKAYLNHHCWTCFAAASLKLGLCTTSFSTDAARRLVALVRSLNSGWSDSSLQTTPTVIPLSSSPDITSKRIVTSNTTPTSAAARTGGQSPTIDLTEATTSIANIRKGDCSANATEGTRPSPCLKSSQFGNHFHLIHDCAWAQRRCKCAIRDKPLKYGIFLPRRFG